MLAESMNGMLKKAREGGYAVGGFDFTEFTAMKAIAAAAAGLKSPVIFMCSSSIAEFLGLKLLVDYYKRLADESGVPCALHLDHGRDAGFLKKCVDAGFTSVMMDASALPFNENIKISKEIADYARGKGVSVEAELGAVAGGEAGIAVGKAEYVNPDMVGEFVAKTNVDALAVGIGTVHGLYAEEPRIRFDLIERIASENGVPLVMHGGTGLPEADYKRAAKCGISKINIGTAIRYAFTRGYLDAAKEKGYACDPQDAMNSVFNEVKKAVEEKIEIFGSRGKA